VQLVVQDAVPSVWNTPSGIGLYQSGSICQLDWIIILCRYFNN
jgi:hypothetical protein